MADAKKNRKNRLDQEIRGRDARPNEPTEEMIAAGYGELFGYDPESDDSDELIRSIYVAMEKERVKGGHVETV